MEKIKKYRYPGINSFETTDTDIFFGREDDRKKLADLVEIEKNVLLYSRSGLGKSSLLKAGLIPELSTIAYQSHYIRLGSYQQNSLPPVQNVLRRTILSEYKQLPVTFLQKFINRTNSLWYAFKSLQIAQPENERPIVLIFDQFEEIASYPARHIMDFKQQIAELLYTQIPKDYLEALKNNDLLTAPLTDAELDQFYKPLRIKVVFAIRSDQMSVINGLSDYLPNILKVFYELKALTPQQALQGIVEPGSREGEFITPVFSYQQDALKKILKALVSEKNNDIDTAQLQILLQYIEQDIVEKKRDIDITAEDLGDLNKVYENYYLNSLSKLTKEQEQAQVLIEDKLIVEGRRISYDKGLCLQLVSNATLDALIETRLLRQEPNTMGGFSYEVSHDSLIAPILETREKRKRKEQEDEKERLSLAEETERKAQYEEQLANQRKKQRQQRLILIIVSLACLVSLSFGIWALFAQARANESRRKVEQTLKEVNIEKAKTQTALNNYIEAEIARKKIEKDQLLAESKTYANSEDFDLKKDAELQAESLEKEIGDLEKRLNK